ncbi:MAG: hypothetical protein FWB75_02470 [Oscillospiraceae bacterium]|nr:hypothetical protein [Oscillospiraceae bacterium]
MVLYLVAIALILLGLLWQPSIEEISHIDERGVRVLDAAAAFRRADALALLAVLPITVSSWLYWRYWRCPFCDDKLSVRKYPGYCHNCGKEVTV